MNWKQLLGSVSESVHNELWLRHDYLVAENRILRNQINGRVRLTDSERKELAEIGAKLGKQALTEITTIAQADTILAWHRKFANQTVNPSAPSPRDEKRPPQALDLSHVVVLSAVCPRPIRDGPIRNRHGYGKFLESHCHEAA